MAASLGIMPRTVMHKVHRDFKRVTGLFTTWTILDKGYHNFRRWCIVAYHIWDAIAAAALSEITGVRVNCVDFIFPVPIEEDPAQLSKMWESWQAVWPIIDADACMTFLMDLVVSKGAKMGTRTIPGDLLHQKADLRTEFDAEVIIKATGLAGTELAGDLALLDAALTITADAIHDASETVFLVPRNDNILLIGGIAESYQDQLDLTPFRQRHVRLERELRPQPDTSTPSRIVLSYGQGRAGWSLSFGCAGDVTALVEEALLDLAPRPMMIETGAEGHICSGTSWTATPSRV
ncbi:D-aspartate oxidase [Naviculisporaceae sp. PSN 640]